MKPLIAFPIVSIAMTAPAFADEQMKLVGVQPHFSCEEAETIKFNKDAYTALNPDWQMAVDLQYQQCGINDKARAEGRSPGQQVVLATDSEGKLFYGIIRRSDLQNAARNCGGVGAIGGAAISVYGTATGTPGAEVAGAVIQEYADVSCSSIADALEGDNLYAVLAPGTLIGNAVGVEVIANILPISEADKEVLKKAATPSVKFDDGELVIDLGPGGPVGIGIKEKIEDYLPKW